MPDIPPAPTYRKSLAAHCHDFQPLKPAGYQSRDEVGCLPTGEWFAFLACQRTHGPLPSEEAARECCNGTCDCWRRREEASRATALILKRLDARP